ncbi:MAG TPA: FecR domain-containing protein [Lentimicrobium sp.]|nr:FecR domain-containing protein [Lentimicrobium sp.]
MIFDIYKYKHLIIKYLQGEATVDEQKLVEDFIAKSERNKQLFESYRGLLFLTQKKKVEYNAEKAWEKVRARILANEKSTISGAVLTKQVKNHSIPKYAISAVAAVMLMVIGWVSLVTNSKPEINKFATGLNISEPGNLPDGSIVVLNSNTTLNFPSRFEKDVREVSIFGEAFFEVKPDPDKPFIIHASGLDIKVLGTSFDVQAYPGSDFIKVTVNTGKVLVYPTGTPSGQEVKAGEVLTAGEIATFSQKSGIISKSVNDDLNVLSWKTGVLTFKETRLAEVFKALEEKYQVQFEIKDSTVLNKRLTARFDQSLDDALETLSLIFNLKFEKKERQIMVH